MSNEVKVIKNSVGMVKNYKKMKEVKVTENSGELINSSVKWLSRM